MYDAPNETTDYAHLVDASGAEGLSVLGAIGVIVVLAGLALVVLNLLVSVAMGNGAEAEADPWGGLTPEWLLDSPPPLGPAEALPELTSGTPLLDAELNGSVAAGEREATEVPA